MAERRELRNRDQGFTLTETLVVFSVLSIITVVFAAVFSVIVRTSPAAEARADDARSIQGLVTWFPQDVTATPPDGFTRDPDDWPCAGGRPGITVLGMRWTEDTGSETSYAASYQFVDDGKARLERHTCVVAGTPRIHNLTSELPSWDPADPPVEVVMCGGPLQADGSCAGPDQIAPAVLAPTGVDALTITLTTDTGRKLFLDSTPNNPDERLPAVVEPSDCELMWLIAAPDPVARIVGGAPKRLLAQDLIITLQHRGTCDGLTVTYDTGDLSGEGAAGAPFETSSTSGDVTTRERIIESKDNGGTEKWSPGSKQVTVRTTSDVTPAKLTTTVTVS